MPFSFLEKQWNEKQRNSNLDMDSLSDDESEDEVNIDLGPNLGCQHAVDKFLDKMNTEERSTHFIAVRVTQQEIVNKALEIQRSIIKKEEVNFRYVYFELMRKLRLCK